MNQTFTMKKLKSLLFAILFCAPLTATAQDIEINAENFPDENFRKWLLGMSYGADGILTKEEIEKVTGIGVSYKNISSLKGIEYFTALTNLSCTDNQLTSLDVSQNTALTWLSCSNNQLTSLDVSQNTALIRLWCGNNQLTTLDVSHNTALFEFSCSDNQLTSLDVSQNTALRWLHCYCNQIRGEAMSSLISSLPLAMGTMYVYYEGADNEGNVCTNSQAGAVVLRGWGMRYTLNGVDWLPYYGIDDESSNIALPELTIESGNTPVYNLAGQKVSSPVKGGIYIVGGKKVVVK